MGTGERTRLRGMGPTGKEIPDAPDQPDDCRRRERTVEEADGADATGRDVILYGAFIMHAMLKNQRVPNRDFFRIWDPFFYLKMPLYRINARF